MIYIPTILIAEDDNDICDLIKMHLEMQGYKTIIARDGKEALEFFKTNHVDLLLLDVMMPYMTGLEVLKEIRKDSEVPVIFLTARSGERDKITGLGLGADDYISKPFSVQEMISRVQALLRRYMQYSNKSAKKLIINGDLEIDLITYICTKNGEELDLNPKEFKLLTMFMENLGRVFTKKQLYESVWDELYWGDDNTIMVHISHLRDKIEEEAKNPIYLKTIRGIGYRMDKIDA